MFWLKAALFKMYEKSVQTKAAIFNILYLYVLLLI